MVTNNFINHFFILDRCFDFCCEFFIAVDRIGAGIGDKVMVTQGSAAAHMASDTPLPIDAIIIGIIDSVDIERGGENG